MLCGVGGCVGGAAARRQDGSTEKFYVRCLHETFVPLLRAAVSCTPSSIASHFTCIQPCDATSRLNAQALVLHPLAHLLPDRAAAILNHNGVDVAAVADLAGRQPHVLGDHQALQLQVRQLPPRPVKVAGASGGVINAWPLALASCRARCAQHAVHRKQCASPACQAALGHGSGRQELQVLEDQVVCACGQRIHHN